MSRTRRNPQTNYFRDPHTQSTRIVECKARDGLAEWGYPVPNRLLRRSSKHSKDLPNSYDDLDVSAYRELDYNKGMFFERNKHESDIKWR